MMTSRWQYGVSVLLALVLLEACSKTKSSSQPPAGNDQYVIEIDIDDHGLKALWDAQAPNLKRMIREGVLAYSRVIVPTHSNESNMALVSGNYPDGNNVPTNAWLDRNNGYKASLSLAGLSVGDYAFYDKSPFNPATPHHVDCVWNTTDAAGLGPTIYVGQLPSWEWGADEIHFSIANSSLDGITLDPATITDLLENTLNYPPDVVENKVHLDGPPNPNETIEHFTIRDAANVWKNASANKPPKYMFVWAFIALDDNPTNTYGADGPQLAQVVEDYDDAIGALLQAIDSSPYKGKVNILFTLDHGKVDTTNQVALGSRANDGQQLAQLVASQGAAHHVGPNDYAILNEDGDAQLYAKATGAGTAAGAEQQQQITHGLVDLIQSGALIGVDTTRTITWDGYRGTRRFHDYRIESPNQADILVFPKDGWTLNDVDKSGKPGPFDPSVHPDPYGRHGGFSIDELYVPLIMWGPAFKQGVVLPHPVNHPDVAPTAMKLLGLDIHTEEGSPITAALVGDPAETLPDPADMRTARDTVLQGSGFEGQGGATKTPVSQVVIVDLAGVYYDEVFSDPTTKSHAAALNSLAAAGVSFESAWNRYRDEAENAYELFAGGAPVVDASGQWVASAEADPSQTGMPGEGLLLEPPPALGTAPNPAALMAWRQPAVWSSDSLLSVAKAQELATAVINAPAGYLGHLQVDSSVQQQNGDAKALLSSFLAANQKALAIVAFPGQRTGDRHSAAALQELDAIDQTVAGLRAAVPNALFVVASRGAADIDDPAGEFYGPQSSRHVPLIIAGPGIRAGVVSGQPATAADLPATVLYALGLPTQTDFVEGTWIQAPANADGVPQPTPAGASAGHVLLRAFTSGQ